jgi:hypothetical protein
MPKLDTLFVIAKLGPPLSTDSSDSARTCPDKLRTNFSEPWTVSGDAVIWWTSFTAQNFPVWISFYLIKWCLKELSTVARMRSRSHWLIVLLPGCRVGLTDLLHCCQDAELIWLTYCADARMRGWSDWLINLPKKVWRSLICSFNVAVLKMQNWILSLSRALLAR